MSGGTVVSVTTEKIIQKKKRNTKSPATSPPIKYPTPNQYINRLITKKDPSLPPHLSKYPPVYKSLINDAHNPNITEDDCNDSTYTSRN